MALTGFKAKNHPQQVGERGARDDVDDRATPPEVFEPLDKRFNFTVDVAASAHNAKCARYVSIERDGLAVEDERRAAEAGGLSGLPLFVRSTALLAEMYDHTEGRVPLIGTGGVANADHAYAKIRAGASLVQLYTALVFAGPGLVADIKRGLAERLRIDGFAHVAEAVGADHR